MDKLKNTLESLTGKAKQTAGEATGNKDLAAEGNADEAKGDLKNAGEKLKDVAKDVKKDTTG